MMTIKKENIVKVIADYGYDEYSKVIAHKNGDIEIVFPCDNPQMDLVYAISGIVQDIIKESGLPSHLAFADIPYFIPSRKNIRVVFKATLFDDNVIKKFA